MREELIVRLRGTWQRSGPVDSELIGAALAPYGAELVKVVSVWPGDLRLLVAVPERADLVAVGQAVAQALALPTPRISYEPKPPEYPGIPQSGRRPPPPLGSGPGEVRGVAGRGYSCSCGGVDGDHTPECPRATP